MLESYKDRENPFGVIRVQKRFGSNPFLHDGRILNEAIRQQKLEKNSKSSMSPTDGKATTQGSPFSGDQLILF